MESFSLLKYWRGGGGGAAIAAAANVRSTSAPTSTVDPSVLRPAAETDEDGDAREHDDDGPFFDLEFAVHDDESGGHEKDVSEEEEEEVDDDEKEFNFLVSSSEGLRSDPVSPSDDLFFKGKLVSLESSIVVATDHKHHHNFPVSFLKSATKLRVLMLGLRKNKSASAVEAAEPHGEEASPKPHGPGKFFVKFKVEEVPIVSLFTRDHSSKISGKPPAKSPPEVSAEENRFAKEVVHKYLNKIKPLYVRVSKRYSEKQRFSGNLTSAAVVVEKEGEDTDAEMDPSAEAAAPPVAACGVRPPRASVPAGLKVVCKRLGKSRSASAAVVAVPSPPAPAPPPQRRDDSLLQQEDGIQSAILHCKRSFNSSKGSESPLVRSMSDPRDGRSEKAKGDSD